MDWTHEHPDAPKRPDMPNFALHGMPFFLFDAPGRTFDELNALKRPLYMHFVSCLVCKNYLDKGFHWIMLESCVKWGFRVPVSPAGSVGVEAWDPEPQTWDRSELAALRSLYMPDNCPDNLIKGRVAKWVVSTCPPKVLGDFPRVPSL
jgi:hypothetical protein